MSRNGNKPSVYQASSPMLTLALSSWDNIPPPHPDQTIILFSSFQCQHLEDLESAVEFARLVKLHRRLNPSSGH